FKRRNEIESMNPRNILSAVPRASAKSATHETKQHRKNPAGIGTHGHGRAQNHLARVRRLSLVAGLLPCVGHLDAEAPRIRRLRFATAQDACVLVVCRVETMCVNRSGSCLQPQPRRILGKRDGLTYKTSRIYPRCEN